jgi:STE24 endopeptidase
MVKKLRAACALLMVLTLATLLWPSRATSEPAVIRDLPPGLHLPDAAKPGPGFDVDRATAAWLGMLSPEQRRLSDAYFEGGYWLKLWDLVYGVGALALLLWSGVSGRMRDLAERLSRRRFASAMIYGAMLLVALFILLLSLEVFVVLLVF